MKNTTQFAAEGVSQQPEDFSRREVVQQLLTKSQRLQRIVLAAVCVAYALYSFLHNDFYLMGKRGPGTHFHGVAAGLLELMLLLAAVASLLPFAYLYDLRPKYPNYEKWRRHTAMAAYGCMGLGMTFGLFQPSLSVTGDSSTWLLRLIGWLGAGVLIAQLGRLPASYQVKKKPQQSDVKLPSGVGYIAVIILWLIAAAFLLLASMAALVSPDTLFSGKAESLMIWILLGLGLAFGAWGRSILRRTRQAG